MPTIITGVKQNMKVAREEIFGPVACFMEPFNSDEKALEMANDNRFGLTSYVWTNDRARGMRFANRTPGRHRPNRPQRRLRSRITLGRVQGERYWKEGSLYNLYEYTNLKRIQVDLRTTKK